MKLREQSAVGLGIALLSGASLLAYTWGTWPDVIADFGRELYLAWRIAEGATLYTDIAHFSGPLSPYVNGFWFRLTGTGLSHLVALNVIVLVAFTSLMFRAIRIASGAIAATAAALVFMTVFAFGNLVSTGNYNWICPYAHEMTHGLTLGIGAILAVERAKALRSAAWASAAGFLLGLALLTRVEPALAAVAACTAGLAAPALRRGFGAMRGSVVAGASGLSALVTFAAAPALLSTHMPWADAVGAMTRGWTAIVSSDVQALRFFRWSLGFDAAGANALTMLLVATIYAAALGVLSLAAFVPELSRRRWAPAVVFLVVAVALGAAAPSLPWWNAARPLPLAMAFLGFLAVRDGLREGRAAREEPALQADLRLMLAVWAMVLLGKMILNARVWQYGFSLAAPATMLAVASLVSGIPGWIATRRGRPAVFRAGVMAFLAVAVVVHVLQSRTVILGKTVIVGQGRDAFRADSRGQLVEEAVDDLSRRLAPSETLAVLPEGAMLNYLARRANSLPYMTLNPTEFAIYGEAALLEALRDHPPDYVAFVHKDTSEFGYRYFGADYGQPLVRWVMGNYTAVARYGPTPFTDAGFGILVAKRKTGKE